MLQDSVDHDHVTLGRLRAGFGLAAACLGALEFLKIPQQEATVAIQGFGGLGSAAAYSLYKAGVKVIGLADHEKSLISNNEHSLDIKALMKNPATGLIPEVQGKGRYVDRSRIYDVECDVFVPAAIENAIVADNAKTISVKAIVPGANLAVTQEAERILWPDAVALYPWTHYSAQGPILLCKTYWITWRKGCALWSKMFWSAARKMASSQGKPL
jgi:glutamate dehydrogenase (NAD(P)+)